MSMNINRTFSAQKDVSQDQQVQGTSLSSDLISSNGHKITQEISANISSSKAVINKEKALDCIASTKHPSSNEIKEDYDKKQEEIQIIHWEEVNTTLDPNDKLENNDEAKAQTSEKLDSDEDEFEFTDIRENLNEIIEDQERIEFEQTMIVSEEQKAQEINQENFKIEESDIQEKEIDKAESTIEKNDQEFLSETLSKESNIIDDTSSNVEEVLSDTQEIFQEIDNAKDVIDKAKEKINYSSHKAELSNKTVVAVDKILIPTRSEVEQILDNAQLAYTDKEEVITKDTYVINNGKVEKAKSGLIDAKQIENEFLSNQRFKLIDGKAKFFGPPPYEKIQIRDENGNLVEVSCEQMTEEEKANVLQDLKELHELGMALIELNQQLENLKKKELDETQEEHLEDVSANQETGSTQSTSRTDTQSAKKAQDRTAKDIETQQRILMMVLMVQGVIQYRKLERERIAQERADRIRQMVLQKEILKEEIRHHEIKVENIKFEQRKAELRKESDLPKEVLTLFHSFSTSKVGTEGKIEQSESDASNMLKSHVVKEILIKSKASAAA